ncbi:hypothetical protein F5Y11DRAFT_14258 [Daldinia sp. FL1419]|nr:hypothetical protein F5Y11DRAFT_14258 [Daldinia sp. FL1419]
MSTPKSTCLSSEEHDCDIKDHLLHYLGCIEFCDQEKFFQKGSQIWKEEAEHQEKVLGHTADEAERLTEQKRMSWQADCENELKRIGLLRRQLSEDKDKNLIERVEESLHKWRNSGEYTTHIKKVQELRKTRGKGSSLPRYIEPKAEEYDPEKDVKVPIIQFKGGQPHSVEHPEVWNKFPNQKTTIDNLLNGEGDLLRQDNSLSKRSIRYFHIPSNNMDWVERAIGQYFGEERPDYPSTHRKLKRKRKTKAYMILRDQYWRGQLHGGQPYSPAHTRHLKPLCATLSSDPVNTKYLHRNMVLFMPYLHWDTSRKSEQFTMEMEEITAAAKEAELRRNTRDEDGRAENQSGRPNNSNSILLPNKQRKSKVKVMTMSKLLRLMREKKLVKSRLDVDGNGRVTVNHPLGQFLLDAARLYEGISNYRDKKLLRRYLTTDPPLHPRRTLDQAYHWTLNSTWERDQDQVVYRHTNAKPESFHKWQPVDNNKLICKEHIDFGIKDKCEECKRNIQKLTRIIMVDQLWMWILDAETIITCFPKRYGSNKQDSSAVHKSIRVRIQDIGLDQIRTAFDLGLIIIEECVNTLFNQSKTSGRQPRVIDAFSETIGNIMHKQSVAFARLWRWTEDAREIYKSNGTGDTFGLHVALLDIYPEGRLEQEIRDVVEELDIMTHITRVHKKMLLAFISNAENILDPFGTFGKSQKREMIGRHLWEKSEETRKTLEEYRDPREYGKGDDGILVEKFEKRRDDYNWFKLNADELLEIVMGRIDELEELRSIAVHTTESVKYLLELKQQQASVVQAWQAIKQSDETIRQGRSIMMFTVVTITFLPLSYMSSVFGMNNKEITDSTWSIQTEFLYMFTISAAVIILSLLLAFGSWIRASLFYLWKRFVIGLVVRSGLYNLWRDVSWSSKEFHHEANALADRLKENARRAHLNQKVKKRQEEERKLARKNREGDGDWSSLTDSLQGNGHVNGYANGSPSEPPNQGVPRSFLHRVRRSFRTGGEENGENAELSNV